MSLMENGSLSASDVAAVTRNNNGGFGGYGDGGFFWIIRMQQMRFVFFTR